jgi:transcriptional regulator with XRE-family HTH domain
MDVLKRLQDLQKEYGWSDYRTAKAAGLARGTVSNIFRRNTTPSFTTLEALCKGFGITLSQFFDYDNNIDTIVITPELKTLFNDWSSLSEDNKKLVQQLINALK